MKKIIFFLCLFQFFYLNAQEKESLSGKLFYNYGGEITWDFLTDSILELSEYIDEKGLVSQKLEYKYVNAGPYYHLILRDDSKELKYVALPGVYDEFLLLAKDNGIKTYIEYKE